MVNHAKDETGKLVIAVGAEGSRKRIESQYPYLIAELNELYRAEISHSHRIDLAIEKIRDIGITDYRETNSILSASLYGEDMDTPGTIAYMISKIK